MDCALGDVGGNLADAKKLLMESKQAGAKLAVLPEMFSTGYKVDEGTSELAESMDGPTISTLLEWANKEDLWISTSFIERCEIDGLVYDTGVLIAPHGVEGIVRKKALWGKETIYFTNDNQPAAVFQTPFGKIGMVICYEVGIPELSRQLALKGAEIILVPSAFGMSRLYAWNLATRSRALENGCYIVASNRIGQDNENEFCGHSRIISPKGEVLQEIQQGKGWVIQPIDINEVYRQRGILPYLQEWKRLNETIDFTFK